MRRAFTILELLAATALTALLTLTVFHVVAGLGRTRSAMAARADAGLWRADLLDLLRRDLANSDTVRLGENKMLLTGHAFLDPSTLTPGGEPVFVVYEIVVLNGRRWLIRRQRRVDESSNSPVWTELICPDVATFQVRPAGLVPATPDADGEIPVPVFVNLRIDNAAGVLIDQTVQK